MAGLRARPAVPQQGPTGPTQSSTSPSQSSTSPTARAQRARLRARPTGRAPDRRVRARRGRCTRPTRGRGSPVRAVRQSPASRGCPPRQQPREDERARQAAGVARDQLQGAHHNPTKAAGLRQRGHRLWGRGRGLRAQRGDDRIDWGAPLRSTCLHVGGDHLPYETGALQRAPRGLAMGRRSLRRARGRRDEARREGSSSRSAARGHRATSRWAWRRTSCWRALSPINSGAARILPDPPGGWRRTLPRPATMLANGAQRLCLRAHL